MLSYKCLTQPNNWLASSNLACGEQTSLASPLKCVLYTLEENTHTHTQLMLCFFFTRCCSITSRHTVKCFGSAVIICVCVFVCVYIANIVNSKMRACTSLRAVPNKCNSGTSRQYSLNESDCLNYSMCINSLDLVTHIYHHVKRHRNLNFSTDDKRNFFNKFGIV